MLSFKIYFITGANRGIGLQLVTQLLGKPNVKVVATARKPEAALELKELASKYQGCLAVVPLDASDQKSIEALPSHINKTFAGEEGIDVYIANAAIADSYYKVLDTPRQTIIDHFNVNVLGSIETLKVVKPFLDKRNSARQIIFISSGAGSVGGYIPLPVAGYGNSKASINYFTRALASELDGEGYTVVAIHPGVVSTDMGNYGITEAAKNGMDMKTFGVITPAESASAQLKVFDNLDKSKSSKFFSYTGDELPW